MRRREFLRGAAAAVPIAIAAGQSQEPAAKPPAQPDFVLPKPQLQGGRPLMQALAERKTNRNISDERLSPQMLSNLLWAGWGINRPGAGGRTAPSAMNVQEIVLYVFLAEGIYRFDAASHSLKPVLAGDHRAQTGSQTGVGKAPVSLVFVADLDKYSNSRGASVDTARRSAWSYAHCGFIAQNVYLFAASEGLASWFRAMIDAPALAKLLNLPATQVVLCSQGVGYPAKA
jgi:hypothetical protein